MRNVPGWMAGALGVTALVGAFMAGGLARATSDAPATPTAAIAQHGQGIAASAPAADVAVECEPGQRAVVSGGSDGGPRVSCVSDPRPVGSSRAALASAVDADASPALLRIADTPARPRARPAAIDGPIEVYRPRSVPVTYSTRDERRPTRTWERSAVIIGSSAAVGATLGGLTKGKKGAVIGGIVGGGAATVWDQVTRRRDDINRR